jgi:DNA-binding IscR family transcriptional regulator
VRRNLDLATPPAKINLGFLIRHFEENRILIRCFRKSVVLDFDDERGVDNVLRLCCCARYSVNF